MTDAEALETATVASISAQGIRPKEWGQRPFRAPHHTASGVALVGGGSRPRPGEISLAHNGVLFLDELPEFDRRVLEVLREPMETGVVTISRAARQAEFPARFQLVAAMNPCPCGYLGDPSGRCHCSANQVVSYRARISGPLLDRIDLHVEVPRLEARQLLGEDAGAECSATVATRVARARTLQESRNGSANSAMTNRQLKAVCALDKPSTVMLEQAMRRLGLSARAHHRLLKVARTIADLDGSERIQARHLGEAIQLRRFESAGTAFASASGR
jgi:magnesium chelatase family protein